MVEGGRKREREEEIPDLGQNTYWIISEWQREEEMNSFHSSLGSGYILDHM